MQVIRLIATGLLLGTVAIAFLRNAFNQSDSVRPCSGSENSTNRPGEVTVQPDHDTAQTPVAVESIPTTPTVALPPLKPTEPSMLVYAMDTKQHLETSAVHYQLAKSRLTSRVSDATIRYQTLPRIFSAGPVSIDGLRQQAISLRDLGLDLQQQHERFLGAADEYLTRLQEAPPHLLAIAQAFHEQSQARSGSPLAEGYLNDADLFTALAAKCVDEQETVRQTSLLVTENLSLVKDCNAYFDKTQEALAFVPQIFDPQDLVDIRPALVAYVKSFDEFQRAISASAAQLNANPRSPSPQNSWTSIHSSRARPSLVTLTRDSDSLPSQKAAMSTGRSVRVSWPDRSGDESAPNHQLKPSRPTRDPSDDPANPFGSTPTDDADPFAGETSSR